MPSWYAINPHIPKHAETKTTNVFTMTWLAYAYTQDRFVNNQEKQQSPLSLFRAYI